MPGMAEVKRWSGGWNEAQEQAEVKGDDKKTLGGVQMWWRLGTGYEFRMGWEEKISEEQGEGKRWKRSPE